MNRALTLENVLNLIPQEEVMQKYLGFKIYPMLTHRVYLNPFREDSNPNCRLVYINGVLNFTDYASPYFGDAVAICSYRLGTNMLGALKHLNKEYSLGLGYDDTDEERIHVPPLTIKAHVPKQYSEIKFIAFSGFSANDYFFRYNITEQTLKKFEVVACQKVWVDTEVFTYTPTCPLYVYCNNGNPYKVYRPLAKREKKWRSNASKDFIQGDEQLKNKNELVIRTSSLKDVMVLYELGIQADAPNCENILLKPREKMILMYDNDNAGITNMIKHSAAYNCDYIILPKIKDLKDPSDFSRELGLDYLRNIITKYNGRFSTDLLRTLRF